MQHQRCGARHVTLVVTLLLAAACSVSSVERQGRVAVIGSGPSHLQLPVFHLPRFSLTELQALSPSAALRERLEEAVFDVGMLAITGWDGTGQASGLDAAALADYAQCAQDGHLYSQLNRVVLGDGSIRSTLATKTDSGHMHSLPGSVELECPELSHSAEQLRAAVGHTGQAYARLLDRLLYASSSSSSSSERGDGGGSSGGVTGTDAAEQGLAGMPPSAAAALLDVAPATPPRAQGAASAAEATLQQQRHQATQQASGAAAAAFPSSKSGPIGSAAKTAESLEHFHVFRRPGKPPVERAALEMHSDMGLFIVMTAARLYRVAGTGQLEALRHVPAGTGLRLELRDGTVVLPEVPEGSLVVMNGEGIERWMPAGVAGRVPYAPGHEVVLPDADADGQRIVRAWFGRMYLPPRDAVLQPAGRNVAEQATATAVPAGRKPSDSSSSVSRGGSSTQVSGMGDSMTFGEYRRQAFSAFRTGHPEQASTVGCAPTRLRVGDEGSCGADEVFCWMVCMKTSHLPCGKDDAQCRNPAGLVWPADFLNPDSGTTDHCYDCAMQCKGQPDLPSGDDKGSRQLCDTNLTAISMFMQGFQTTSRNGGPCLVYLFPWLALTSWARFFLACIGTIAMGVCSASLAWAARLAQERMPTKRAAGASRWPRFKSEALLTAIYAVRITLAYFLMLLAMTYQFELFVMVVVGLTLGHYLFAVRTDEEEEENVDPCCC